MSPVARTESLPPGACPVGKAVFLESPKARFPGPGGMGSALLPLLQRVLPAALFRVCRQEPLASQIPAEANVEHACGKGPGELSCPRGGCGEWGPGEQGAGPGLGGSRERPAALAPAPPPAARPRPRQRGPAPPGC